MGIKSKKFDELTTEVVAYLHKLSYSDSRISQYRSAWQRLAAFMKDKNLHQYSATVGESFIYYLIADRSYDELERWEKDIIQCANVLTEFQEIGSVKFRRIQKFRELKGPVGETMTDYFAYRKSLGIAQTTVDEYKLHLSRFLHYLNENKIIKIGSVNQKHIMEFINNLGFYTPHTRHRMLSILKGYFRYLYDNNQLEIDYSQLIPKDKFNKQPKLPTVYSMDEVESLISAIDRSNPKGKRDYAMILLAARLGLRASDICNIKFENLQWEQNLIVLTQNKTGNKIELPLMSEFGEAVIDYLKYGRPVSKLPYIFLRMVSPYDRLNRSTLHSIVCFYLRRAGISYDGERKHGPHALRHSLAGILLEKKTPIPVISEVLGHKNTESTKLYLRIDIESLRQCALEVPPLSTIFYERGFGNE